MDVAEEFEAVFEKLENKDMDIWNFFTRLIPHCFVDWEKLELLYCF